MKNKARIGIIGAVIFIGFLVYLTMGQKQHRVKVCVEYNGRENCRVAAGATKEQAQRAATDTACATIASGMTETMSCSHSQPKSVRFLN